MIGYLVRALNQGATDIEVSVVVVEGLWWACGAGAVIWKLRVPASTQNPLFIFRSSLSAVECFCSSMQGCSHR